MFQRFPIDGVGGRYPLKEGNTDPTTAPLTPAIELKREGSTGDTPSIVMPCQWVAFLKRVEDRLTGVIADQEIEFVDLSRNRLAARPGRVL